MLILLPATFYKSFAKTNTTKRLLDEVFVISRIIKVEEGPSASADNLYRDLLLYIERKKWSRQ